MTRPDYIRPDWLRCTGGMAFAYPPPEHLQNDRALRSNNPWEQLVAVLLQAQVGDFRNVALLLKLAHEQADSHLRDCAISIFGLVAPSNSVAELVQLFDHSDHDTRLEAYCAAKNTCLPRLALAMARHRGRYGRFEDERLMDHISDILEPDCEHLELTDHPVEYGLYVARVKELVDGFVEGYGADAAVRYGEPLDADQLMAKITTLCAEDEPETQGGIIASGLALLEGMTGWAYAGCLNASCEPILAKIAHTLHSLRQSGILPRLEPGRRYFVGYPLP